MKKKVIVLLGPTATGKSNLGIELAKIVGGEIISGDSVLVYQGLNIGSAKPSESEMSGIKHYMIDILSAEQNFDVLTFKQTVEELQKAQTDLIAKHNAELLAKDKEITNKTKIFSIKNHYH